MNLHRLALVSLSLFTRVVRELLIGARDLGALPRSVRLLVGHFVAAR